MKSAIKVLTSDGVANNLDKLSFDIISVAWLNESQAKKSPRDILNYYKILVMLKGNASIYIGKNIYYTKSGDCILFAPGSLYHAEISDGEGCQFAAINFTLSTPVEEKDFQKLIGIKDIAIYPQLISDNLTTSIVNIFENCVNEKEGYYLQALLLLKRLVGTIFYRGHTVTTTDSATAKSRAREEHLVLMCHRHLINNPNTAVTVEDLCRLCNVSQSYLYKCFNNVLGQSTKQFITNTKLDIAAKELLQTDKSVAQIAQDNGYNNGYQFSNIFKKKYHISPSEYRKNNR